MFAVIETGGKQFRVAPGDVIQVDTLAGDVGAEVEFGKVLAISGDQGLKTGGELSSATIKGTIVSQGRGDKVIVFKFKRKKQYKRTIGHRRNFTAVKVGDILA